MPLLDAAMDHICALAADSACWLSKSLPVDVQSVGTDGLGEKIATSLTLSTAEQYSDDFFREALHSSCAKSGRGCPCLAEMAWDKGL